MREMYLQFYVEDEGLLEDLDLECLVKAPFLHGRVFKENDVFIAPRRVHIRNDEDEWEEKADRLSLRVQGPRTGFLSHDIAGALDPRMGSKMFDEKQFLAVPINLSASLHEQWEHIRPWLDDLADYAYRFTKTRRPRIRTNIHRDTYIFLSVRVERRTVFKVALEVFPGERRPSRESKVRKIVANIARIVRDAGIQLPSLEMPVGK